jgi:hypothetical protein
VLLTLYVSLVLLTLCAVLIAIDLTKCVYDMRLQRAQITTRRP